MKSPNQLHQRNTLLQTVVALGTLAAAMTALGAHVVGRAPKPSNNEQGGLRQILVDPADHNIEVMLQGPSNMKASQVAYVTADKGGHWTQVETPPLDALKNNPLIVNASFAEPKGGGDGQVVETYPNQFVEFTYASNDGNTTTVALDEITPSGNVERLDAESVDVSFSDFAPGEWTQTSDGQWAYTLQPAKGGPDMPHISVSEGSGK